MLSTLFQPCEVKVNLIQNVTFLRPPQRPKLDYENRQNELPPLSNDELVRGIVHLFVPVCRPANQSARHIDGIRVQLRVTQTLAVLDAAFNYVPSTWENSTLMERTLEIGVPMRLSKLNPHRDASASLSRAPSPNHPTYGGGGRHSESRGRHGRSESGGVFKNMVRGVSRGRTVGGVSPGQSGGHTPDRGYPTPSPSTSRARSPGPSAGTSARLRTDSEGHPITDDDFQRINWALQDHDADEQNGPVAHNEAEVTTRDHSGSRFSSLSRPPRPVERALSPEVERRGRSTSQHPAAGAAGVVVRDDNEDGLELSKGVHTFEFAFIIPADAPPYDRSPFGKIRYAVKVTALGAGRARSNVEAWRDFFPMVNPSPDGGMTPMSVLYNDDHPTLGMLSVACTSNNISVGGLFNIDIHGPAPPRDLLVYMVRVSLHTTIELHTKRKGKQLVPVQKRKLFEQGHVVPQDVSLTEDINTIPGYVRYAGTDDAWTVQGVARIPDDNAIRPSTMAGTRSALRFHHVLVVEIVHSRSTPTVPDCLAPDGRRKLKVFTLRQNILVPSCCCALDAVTLPAYTATETFETDRPQMKHGLTSWEQIVRANQDRGESHNMCVCGMSLADLSAAEEAMLPTPNTHDLAMEQVHPNRKAGELPTEEEARQEGGVPTLVSPATHGNASERAAWAPPPSGRSPRTGARHDSPSFAPQPGPSSAPAHMDLPPAYIATT